MANASLHTPSADSILEGLPLALLKLDRQFRVVYYNPSVSKMLGRPSDAILGLIFFELIPEFERGKVESFYRSLTYGSGSFTYSHQAEDFSSRITHKIFLDEGDFTVLLEKEAQLELSQQQKPEKEFIDIYEGDSLGILIFDSLSGHLVHFNKIIQDWTGYTGQEIENLSLANFFSKEDLDLVSNGWSGTILTLPENFTGISLLTKEAGKIPVELQVVSKAWNGRPCHCHYIIDLRTKGESLKIRTEWEKCREIIGNLSIRFINLLPTDQTQIFEEALEVASKLSQSECAFIIRFDKKTELAHTDYAWLEKGLPSFRERMRILPLALLSPLWQKLKAKELVEYPDIEILSDEDSVKSILLLLKIQSLILFPIGEGDDILGVVGFGKVNRRSSHSALELFPIRTVSGMISSTLIRQNMEQVLLERDEENEKLFINSPVGLIYQDQHGTILKANSAALHLLDISLDQVLGWEVIKSEWTAFTEKGTQLYSFKEAAKKCVKSSLPLTDQTIRVFRPSKQDKVWLSVDTVPEFKKGASSAIGAITTLKDITKQKKQEHAMILAEKRYRSLMENLPGSVYLSKADRDFTVIELTDKIFDLTGYTKEEFLSLEVKIQDLIHPDDHENFFKGTQKSLLKKEPYQLKYRITTKSGQVKWIEDRGEWLNEEEDSGHILGFFNDISKEVENSLALEKNLKLLEALVENSHSSIFVKDTEAKYLMVNRKWEMVTGFSREQVIGKKIDELLDPKRAKNYIEDDRKVLVEGKTSFAEEILEHQQSESGFRGAQYFLSVKFPYRNYRGEIIGMCGISTDITAVKEASMMVEEREANLHSILESVNESILSLDKNLNILYSNQTFFKEFFKAYGVEIAKGMNIIKVLPDPKEKEKWNKRYRSVLNSGKTLEFFDQIPTPTKTYQLNVIIYPIKINGMVEGITVFSKDITEKMALEESSKLYLNLFEIATNEIYLISSQFLTIKQSNQAAQKNTGYPLEETLGISILKLIPEKDQALFIEKARSISSKEERSSILELNFIRRDGSLYVSEVLLQLFNYEGEDYLSAFVTDISERKRTLYALEESELRFSQIFKENVTPMLLIDPSTGKIEDANYSAADYYGLEMKKLKSLHLLDINHTFAEEPEYMKAATKEVLESGKGKFLFNHKLKSGEIRSVEVFCSKISINNRELVHEIIQDVTDRNNYYNAVIKLNEALREIAWIQSHVVRAPLAKIMGLVQLLQDEKERGDETLFEFIFNAILQAANELDKVILTVSNKSHDTKHLMN